MSSEPATTTPAQAGVIVYASVRTPLGPIWLAATPEGLVRVSLRSRGERAFLAALRGTRPAGAAAFVRDDRALREASSQIAQYFAGHRKVFTLPVDLRGATPFQRRVLRATARVPFGRVVPYGAIARAIGSPGASRAVGNALGSNPVPIVIPCHRIVAGDGSIGGFTGGTGLKRTLLEVEGIAL